MDHIVNTAIGSTEQIKVPFQPVTSAIASTPPKGTPKPSPHPSHS